VGIIGTHPTTLKEKGMKYITTQQAVNMIYNTKGRIFCALFTKRTTGELRQMVCRLGVKSYLKGGELNYDPHKKRLIIVFDMNINEYRAINLDALHTISIGGVKYTIKHK